MGEKKTSKPTKETKEVKKSKVSKVEKTKETKEIKTKTAKKVKETKEVKSKAVKVEKVKKPKRKMKEKRELRTPTLVTNSDSIINTKYKQPNKYQTELFKDALEQLSDYIVEKIGKHTKDIPDKIVMSDLEGIF
jgi:outer membrane biosynthesis protein TonB